MTEEILDLGDVRLCVETFGQAGDPTILLISGAAESMDGWDPTWCEELAAAGRRVVRYDHRDTGRSTSSPAGHPLLPAPGASYKRNAFDMKPRSERCKRRPPARSSPPRTSFCLPSTFRTGTLARPGPGRRPIR